MNFQAYLLYLGLKKDNFKICDEDFIMRLFGKTKAKKQEKNYYKTMFKTTDDRIKEIEFETENLNIEVKK